MSEPNPYFETMLKAVFDNPVECGIDHMCAQLALEGIGASAVEAAIVAGDPYACALWRLAQGETRESLRQWAETAAKAKAN